MSICFITLTSTGALIRQENETYFQAAQWCRLNNLAAADVLFSATPPRGIHNGCKKAAFRLVEREPSLLRRLFPAF